MKSMPKWLLIPPAVALLLVLGPLAMPASQPTPAAPEAAMPTAEQPTAGPRERGSRASLAVPRSPDFLQIGSTLLGVLLLGGGGIALLRRLRGGAPAPRGAQLMTLRQTLRLSPQKAVHAIEFDDRILLVGENDRGLALLDSGRMPERSSDEAEVLARTALAAATSAEEEGATPRNLVIPRPEVPARKLPRPPIDPAARPAPGLGDFRSLLQKAGRA